MADIKLMRMVRGGQFADVHPDEVENYKLGDWREAEDEPKPKKGKSSGNTIPKKPKEAEK